METDISCVMYSNSNWYRILKWRRTELYKTRIKFDEIWLANMLGGKFCSIWTWIQRIHINMKPCENIKFPAKGLMISDLWYVF
jgi:hypothetical protein